MGTWNAERIVRRARESHAVFLGLWALLLVAVCLWSDPQALPWALLLGLVPCVAGFAALLFWRKEGPAREIALTAGELLGVALGSAWLVRSGSPLMLVALWPVAWAALRVPLDAGLGEIAAATAALLALGLWRAAGTGQTLLVLLSALLYLAAFCGTFLLLRPAQSAAVDSSPAPAEETKAASPPRPELLVAPPPAQSDEDALHQDLRVARDIQVSLLLASSPRLPGWESSTSFLPARELGGDLYDFVELDPQHCGIMIGDVSGKGIPAALHMAVARTLFRVEARQHNGPAETLQRVNRALIEQAPQGYVSLLYAQLNVGDGLLHMANAGHNYPILLDESVHELVLDGLPLGIDGEYAYGETSARLKPGDVLVLYTDGVVEAVNPANEPFGFERLFQLLTESSVRRPRTLTRQIVRAVRSFSGATPQSDDITLLVLRRRHEDRVREMCEVAEDVLGMEGGDAFREKLEGLHLAPDAPLDAWRTAIMNVAAFARERWGQGVSRELTQQLLLTLEGF